MVFGIYVIFGIYFIIIFEEGSGCEYRCGGIGYELIVDGVRNIGGS